MKRNAEYIDGPEALSNFERTMRGLFQVTREETPARPKRERPRKKLRDKGAR